MPWLWLPSVRGTAALVLVLAACGLSGGRAPDLGPIAFTPGSHPATTPQTAESPPATSEAPPPVSPAGRLDVPVRVRRGHSPERAAPVERRAPSRSTTTAGRTSEDLTPGSLSSREIALTFDGCSEANVAGEILDMLRAHNVHTTMFLTGQFIRVHPDWVRRMVADGHEIGNHLDTHPHLTTYETNRRQQTLPGVTRDMLIGQLAMAEASIRNLTGHPMVPLWRAPYGEHNVDIRAWAAAAGYRHISWTRGVGTAEDLDTRDWVADRSSRSYRSREEIAARIVEFGKGRPEGLNGGIILMHLATHRKTDRPHKSLPGDPEDLAGSGAIGW